MSQGDPENSSPTNALYFLLLLLITVAYSAWVLSLPLFPTQDGPMHLYFTHVLQSVLVHGDGFYAQFYFVRHLLPPYALYYYALMLFSAVMPVLLADKLIVCLYFFSFAFGFRYLARSVGPNADVMALLATVLLLNWPLGMGFLNFCLSTSLALWALGLWCRAARRRKEQAPDHFRLITFVVLAYVIMLTHPVPLLAVFGFCSLDLVIRWIRHRRPKHETAFPDRWLVEAGYLLAATFTLAYVKLFTTSHLLKAVHLSSEPPMQAEISLLKSYVLLHTLAAFAGRGIIDIIYRAIFYSLLGGSLWLVVRQFVRARRANVWTMAQTWAVSSVLFLIAFPFIPSDLNNSAYFSARLVLFVWIGAMIAGAGASFDRAIMRPLLASVAVFATILTLGMAQRRIRPIANDIARIEHFPALPQNSVGLLMHSPDYKVPSTVTYDPYFWSGVRLFRRTDSVLYNTPWLDLPIIPLGPKSSLPTYRLSPNDLEFPPGLRKTMAASPGVRTFVLTHVDDILFSFGQQSAFYQPDALLAAQASEAAQASVWACNIDGDYTLCGSHQAEDKSHQGKQAAAAPNLSSKPTTR